jgi:hypothetical protein
MPSEMVDALHIIGNFSGDEYFDDLLELARRELIEVDGKATAPDLATRLYLHDPQVLARKEREQLFEKRKTFESYRAANPDTSIRVSELPSDLWPLESDLDGYFEPKKRGVGCRIIRKTPPVRFVSWCNTANPASVSRAAKARSLPAHSSGPRRRTL